MSVPNVPRVPEVQPVGVDAIVERLDRLEERFGTLDVELAANQREYEELTEARRVAEGTYRDLLLKLRALTPA